MQLYLVGKILHSDFAGSNVVFGKPGAEPGNRGILIDLDLARPLSDIPKENFIVVSVIHRSTDTFSDTFHAFRDTL